MSWLKRRRKAEPVTEFNSAFCKQCGVFFKKDTDYLGHGYSDYCRACARPLIDVWQRKRAVTDFVTANWERYEKRVLADKKRDDAVRLKQFAELAKANAGANQQYTFVQPNTYVGSGIGVGHWYSVTGQWP